MTHLADMTAEQIPGVRGLPRPLAEGPDGQLFLVPYAVRTALDLTSVSPSVRADECGRERLCQICGEPLDGTGFGFTQSGGISGNSLMHRGCLLLSMESCPYISKVIGLNRVEEDQQYWRIAQGPVQRLTIVEEPYGVKYKWSCSGGILARETSWLEVVKASGEVAPQLRALFTAEELALIEHLLPVVPLPVTPRTGDTGTFSERVMQLLKP
jgi:hypothetical protein